MSATLFKVSGGVGTITLNRPDNRNALSTELVESLRSHMDEAIVDPAVRVIVLTGAGTVFCAGADLKERRTVSTATARGRSGMAPGLRPGRRMMWPGRHITMRRRAFRE